MNESRRFRVCPGPYMNGGQDRLDGIFAELLLNALAAGASRVDVYVWTGPGWGRVCVTDEGCGFADPETLLNRPADSEPCARRPAAADVRLAVLSRRGATITSRTGATEHGWRTDISPAHFAGRDDVPVEQEGTIPGTQVCFDFRLDSERPEYVLQAAARYFPLPIYLNGERVFQADPMDGAFHLVECQGVRIGVFRTAIPSYLSRLMQPHQPHGAAPEINFLGRPLSADLPCVDSEYDQIRYHARLDIVDAPHLRFTSGARGHLVDDAALEDLKTNVERTIYRAVATLPEHRLPFAAWKRASGLGVQRDLASAELPLYEPMFAEDRPPRRDPPKPLPGKPILATGEVHAPADRCLARAFARAGCPFELRAGNEAYLGYGWYDAIPSVDEVRWFVTIDGERREVEDLDTAAEPVRPDAIEAEVTVASRTGDEQVLTLPTDVLLTGEPGTFLDEITPLIVKDADLELHDLRQLLADAYCCPYPDLDHSAETQRERFDDQAFDRAIGILASGDAAAIAWLDYAVRRDLVWRAPAGRVATIRIGPDRGDLRIEIEPDGAQDAPGKAF